MTREELQARWAAQREAFDRAGALVNGSKIVGQFLIDLANVEQAEADTILTLKQAAAQSGYTVDHLARLVREGSLPNAGRKGAPRIRLGDLPTRRQFAKNRSRSYSVDADVQSILSRRGER